LRIEPRTDVLAVISEPPVDVTWITPHRATRSRARRILRLPKL
jgi:hypothetical protein